jgi:hypothetical protein
MIKLCTKCGINKEEAEFHKNSKNRSGLGCYCKVCSSKLRKLNYEKHKTKENERSKNWRKKNPDGMKKNSIAWAISNPERKKELGRRWSNATPERKKAACKKSSLWIKENRDRRRLTSKI